MSQNTYYNKKPKSNPSNPIEILKKQNASLSHSYKELVIKFKKMQSEYESMYSKFLNENKMRENNIKNNYNRYQDLLQQHFQKEENNYLEEIKNLKMQIQEKDKIINILQNNNNLLNDKLTKNELIFNLKEKDYQKQLLNKDRLLMKSSDVVNKNSQEVMNDIKKLKEEIQFFQNKAYNRGDINYNNNNVFYDDDNNFNNYNSCNNFNSWNNDNYQNYFNYFNNDYKKQKIKKSFSSIDFNNTKNYKNTINNMNNINNNIFPNDNKVRNFYSYQASPCTIKNRINTNTDEIHKLKTRIINLINIIKQKDKEILYWKNMRQNIYVPNTTQNMESIYNKNFMNNYSNYNYNIRNQNLDPKFIRRCNSQSSSQMQRNNKKKNFNLYLVDSNINKPIRRNIITFKNNTNN